MKLDEHEIEELIEQCKSDIPDIKAVTALKDAQVTSAIPVIRPLVESEDPSIRAVAVEALGYLGKNDVETIGPILEQLLLDPDPDVRSESLYALWRLNYTSAVALIRPLLINDPDRLVRSSAADVLGDLAQNDEVITDLVLSLNDPDELVRAYTAMSIGVIGKEDLLPLLETYLNSEESLLVMMNLLGARYRLGAAEEMTRILNLLREDDLDWKNSVRILNLLKDLSTRCIPTTLKIDAARIRGDLMEAERRFPIVHNDVNDILRRLAELELEG